MSHTFQVDLRGIVDLLSHHLYGSPRVYIRELMQNAVDAITARHEVEPGAPASIWFETPQVTGDGTLRVHDTGVGLTEAQVHELLATIGRSGKRDELGFSRAEFLGQFGIGLLSCFMVADEIRVQTRNGDHPTVYWTGFADGKYEVKTGETRAERGTTVTLVPRRDATDWLQPARVTDLARLFGSLLPFGVRVDGELITEKSWLGGTRPELMAFAEQTLGFTPFDVIELRVPEAGLTGVAYVLPIPANPAARSGHRVYLKRMLLAEGAEGLLPEWAFFARCVVDATGLRPTASREALYDDSLLESVREQLGDQLRGWLVSLAKRDPHRLHHFLDIHNLGVKTLALHDDEMLRLVDEWWPLETNMGRMPMKDFRERFGVVRYCATIDEFRQLAAVAAAADLAVINGGYIHDADLIERLPALDASILVDRLDPSDLTTRFDTLDPATELALRPFLATAQRSLDRLGCEVVMRSFDPIGLPALFLVDREATFQRQLRETREVVDDAWAGILAAFEKAEADSRPQLVLNHRNPLVRRVAALGHDQLIGLAVESLYGQALLLGHHPLRPADSALLNRSFLGLLEHAVPGEIS
ncbi:molecular chaperone HtpG [Allocatelliglobosispora scoriae]|uniref:Molecular chaperone HtpG n=1 Tax=Allocatelliglobosispora scoriae TaxID=643052 RepID=A0A841BTL1_9ACTN|nr:HSP90 family protein [Allocatelliglobosispora scoriae]MBB5871035.1 molecular chaperone HtpG [Allocatelliglobosispora scoriae]